MAGVMVHLVGNEISVIQALIHGTGCLAVAMFCHRLYVKRNFVERGDPALAWLVGAWLVVMLSSEDQEASVRSWVSLVLLCWSADFVLQMHRQSSTSNLQFRSGTLAALAVALQPMNVAFFIGLFIIQILIRPAIIREWLMLFVGAIWGFIIAFVGSQSLASWDAKDSDPHSMTFTNPIWMGLTILGIWGLIQLVRDSTGVGLKTRNARTHLTMLLHITAAGSLLFFLISSLPGVPNMLNSFDALSWDHALKLLGMTLGFTTVSLVPKNDGRKKRHSTFESLQFLLLVGMMLVLFGFNLTH